MADYSGPGRVIYKGKIDVQVQQLTVDFDAGNKDIVTQELGYAGHSRGAKKISASWDYALPKAGAFIDWVAVSNSQKEIVLAFEFAGKHYDVRGNVPKAGLKSSAEGECNGNASFSGAVIAETAIQS